MNRSEVVEDPGTIPSPPFFGARVIDIPIQELFAMLNLPALYRVSWGAKNAAGEKWEQYTRDFSARLEKLKSDQEQDPGQAADDEYRRGPFLDPDLRVLLQVCRGSGRKKTKDQDQRNQEPGPPGRICGETQVESVFRQALIRQNHYDQD